MVSVDDDLRAYYGLRAKKSTNKHEEKAVQLQTPPCLAKIQLKRRLHKERHRQFAAKHRQLILEKAISPPVYPYPALIINKEGLGDVFVTEHAWKRFVKRYAYVTKLRTPGWYLPEYFIRKIENVFGRSHKAGLSKLSRAYRMISNDYVPVQYFLDHILGLRFVVKRCETTFIMLTAEIAYHR